MIPSIDSPSSPLDIYNVHCPSMMLTEVDPKCDSLDPWNTVAITNWDEDAKRFTITLSENIVGNLNSENFLVSEFMNQETLGIFSVNDRIELGSIPPHESRLLRIAPWNGKLPVLAGTDLHFSGGGVEIDTWQSCRYSVEGKIETEWNYPVRVAVAFPSNNKVRYVLKTCNVPAGQKRFYIQFD